MPWETIIKSERDWPVAPNLRSYETARAEFSWDAARRELDGLPGGAGLEHRPRSGGPARRGTSPDHLALRWIGKAGRDS